MKKMYRPLGDSWIGTMDGKNHLRAIILYYKDEVP